jgi:hypothetical protein
MVKHIVLSLFATALFFSSSTAIAWGGRGHYTICEAAVFLLKEKSLKESLQQKPFMMGHLCNIPDFYWKSLGPEVGKLGNATHFIDVEITGLALKDVPLDYQKVISTYTGQKNQFKKDSTIFNVPTEFGSNWWRADQFYRRAVGLGKEWKTAAPPTNGKEEQDENLPYNKNAYDFYVNLGLMGHFVADNGQPFHGTADYDGYAAGHGGIHAYFEDSIVGTLPYNLMSKVVEDGQRLQKMAISKNKEELKQARFLNEKTVLEKMRSLGEISLAEIPKIYALDPIKKPSIEKSEKGMSLRTPAERAAPETVSPKFEKLVIREMARSAALLAQIWDEAYVQVGQPKLGAYKSYKFPFTPDFVPPDYFDVKELEKKTK